MNIGGVGNTGADYTRYSLTSVTLDPLAPRARDKRVTQLGSNSPPLGAFRAFVLNTPLLAAGKFISGGFQQYRHAITFCNKKDLT